MNDLPDWLKKRSAGCLLHITSLPGNTDIGNLGRSCYEFIDFLKKSGFSYWQMCPVGPTGFGDSPYQVFSSSAGNPYLIDWHPLIEKNLLSWEDLTSANGQIQDRVEYGLIYETFFKGARKAYQSFQNNQHIFDKEYGEYNSFLQENRTWLEPYAAFQSFKKKFSNQAWWNWEKNHKKEFYEILKEDEFDFQVFLQYLFRGQWKKLKNYASSQGISLLGDLPIYAAPDSAEVWHRPELFQVDQESFEFTSVAGVPPDYFNSEGQHWGNPLYQWDLHEKDDFAWWTERLREQLKLFDVVRIDHFRGFHDYWSIPSGTVDARLGSWSMGPGINFWKCMQRNFPSLPFLAEDLGLITGEVRELRIEAGLPGMAVLQFAFDGDPQNLYLPHNLSPSLVLYTGTHDNDTTMGWYINSEEEIRTNFRSYLNVAGHDAPWDMLRLAYRSISPLVIVPVQDLLSLGSEARFNKPGTPHGNWQWRMSQEQLVHLCENNSYYLREQAKITGRLSSSNI